jgi:hypothetical protein
VISILYCNSQIKKLFSQTTETLEFKKKSLFEVEIFVSCVYTVDEFPADCVIA